MRPAVKANRHRDLRRVVRQLGAVGVLSGVVGLLQACGGSDATAPKVPANASPESQVVGAATVGTTLDSPIRLFVSGADNQPLAGALVQWEVSNGGKVSATETRTDASGIASVRWTLGKVAGLQSITARVNGLPPIIFGANATPDRAAIIRFTTDLVRVTLLGDTVRFATSATDQYGNPVIGTIGAALESGTAVSASGSAFVARGRGNAVIRASLDTASARLTVIVDPATPVVTRVSPDTLVPGGTVVIEGSGFALAPDAVDLSIGNVKATVSKVSASRIEAVLPTSYGCLATGLATVRVTIAAASGQQLVPMRTATIVTLAKGESANILSADQVRCTELVAPANAGRTKYVVAVINTSAVAAATSGFELHGAGAGAMSGRIAQPTQSLPAISASPVALPRSGRPAASLAAEAAAVATHATHLEAERALASRYGSPAPTWRALAAARKAARGSASVAASAATLRVGDTVPMRALFNSCSAGREVRARVVYVGTKSVVLEDVLAARAGALDAEYRQIGDEFDRVQYPLLQSKVGDPLAMNSTMQGDGRITMLFTRYVNDSLPGVAGFVSSCNFYPKGTFAASNEDEVFYARVLGSGESPSEWRRGMRSTVIHEAKHLAAFAQRFLDGSAFEESWLEESTARIAEELYSRTFANGGDWKTNTGFAASVGCELTQCDDRPLTMWKHFSALHDYLRGVDTLTPIGAAAGGDFTYYASGWSLVRWAIDQYAVDESAFLKALVRGGTTTGVGNLAQRTGRPSGEMLADWALANAVDDLRGFVPFRAQLTFPSWNSSEIYAGLSGAFPGAFVASPLRARTMTFGAFSLPVSKLRAFSSSYFSFEGDQTGSQLIDLHGENGGAIPPTLRIAIVRVE